MTDKETRMKMTSHLAVIGLLACAAGSALAQARTEITLARFFGSCEADYSKSIHVKAARGAGGIFTTLVNSFKAVGIDTAQFSDQARAGTSFPGKTYALPFDTHAWLWHFNLNLMKKAGLTKPDGSPVIPSSPEELFAQARQFKQATGKPYFAWQTVNSSASYMRTFLTLLYQQNGAKL